MIFFLLPKEISDVQISSAPDGNAKPPASGIPRDGLQCTEHLKYMGTICGGNVVLNDLEEFGRSEADEKSISRQTPRSQMSWKTLESPGSNQRHQADRKILRFINSAKSSTVRYKTNGSLVNFRRMPFQSTQKTTWHTQRTLIMDIWRNAESLT